jgi:hypothetical protein
MFFNEVVGKKNKHKNRKAIWFEYIIMLAAALSASSCPYFAGFYTAGVGAHFNRPHPPVQPTAQFGQATCYNRCQCSFSLKTTAS